MGIVNLPEPPLCDGGPAGVTAYVAEELFLAAEPLDVSVPPPLLLPLQEVLELGCTLIGLQEAPAMRFSQVGYHGVTPQGHQRLPLKPRLPPGRAVGIETAFGEEQMEVAIEVQFAPKGMRDHQNHQPHAVCVAGPMFDHFGSQNRQIVQEVAVLLE